jgi:hypothetical protein
MVPKSMDNAIGKPASVFSFLFFDKLWKQDVAVIVDVRCVESTEGIIAIGSRET